MCRNGFPQCQASQCSLHNAPIFRLLLKVAVNGTHQCESLNFCGALSPNLCRRGFDLPENGSGMNSKPAGQVAHSHIPAQALKPFSVFLIRLDMLSLSLYVSPSISLFSLSLLPLDVSAYLSVCVTPRMSLQKSTDRRKADSTLRTSRVVPHPSINRALYRLTLEVDRDPVQSTRYGRQRIC